MNSNANLVPTVANGKVYVASNKQLQIFGLFSGRPASKAPAASKPLAVSEPGVVACPPEVAPLAAIDDTGAGMHEFRGTVCKVTGNELRVALPGQRSISVDITGAVSHHRSVLLVPGRPIKMRATIDSKGLAHARKISRAHAIPELAP